MIKTVLKWDPEVIREKWLNQLIDSIKDDQEVFQKVYPELISQSGEINLDMLNTFMNLRKDSYDKRLELEWRLFSEVASHELFKLYRPGDLHIINADLTEYYSNIEFESISDVFKKIDIKKYEQLHVQFRKKSTFCKHLVLQTFCNDIGARKCYFLVNEKYFSEHFAKYVDSRSTDPWQIEMEKPAKEK